jgi:hypothetical protein
MYAPFRNMDARFGTEYEKLNHHESIKKGKEERICSLISMPNFAIKHASRESTRR